MRVGGGKEIKKLEKKKTDHDTLTSSSSMKLLAKSRPELDTGGEKWSKSQQV